MANKKRGLGRGLSDLGLSELLGTGSLIGAEQPVPVPVEQAAATSEPVDASVAPAPDTTQGVLQTIAVGHIQPGPYQPRAAMDPVALQELSQSIRAQGVIQPIVLRATGENRYEIIAGERRWRAAQLAGLHQLPAVVRDVTDEAAMVMALVENIQRSALNAIEEAMALQRLIEQFHLTHQAVADAVGSSRARVSNLLRLLTLDPSLHAWVAEGKIEMGHARALLTLEPHQQCTAAQYIVDHALSVRQAERLVRRYQNGEAAAGSVVVETINPDIMALQNELSDHLGSKVSIQQGARGNGKLIVQYSSLDELEGILDKIRQRAEISGVH